MVSVSGRVSWNGSPYTAAQYCRQYSIMGQVQRAIKNTFPCVCFALDFYTMSPVLLNANSNEKMAHDKFSNIFLNIFMTLSQKVIECFMELPKTALRLWISTSHKSTFPYWLTAVCHSSTLAALPVSSGATGGIFFKKHFTFNISYYRGSAFSNILDNKHFIHSNINN